MKHANLAEITSERIASHCVCCGSAVLRSSPAIMMPFISDRIFGWKPIRVESQWGLRTIDSGMAYALCNSFLCTNCELLFLDIRFTGDEMKRLYYDYRGEEYMQLRNFYEPGYAIRNEELAIPVAYLHITDAFLVGFVPGSPRILDWGGHTGTNTPLKGIAKEIDIYDISQKLTCNSEGGYGKKKLHSKTFDLITCCNVLEHVPHPFTVLTEIKELMSEMTVLFIEVPYETLRIQYSSDVALTLKRHWHEHINFFSEKSLHQLIALSNLHLLAFRNINTNESGNQTHVFQIICKKVNPVTSTGS